MDNFATAAETYYEGATSAAQAAWDAMNDEIDGYDIADYSTEEVNALTEKINAVIAGLRAPEGSEVYTQYIVNPSFETGDFTGWTYNTAATGDTRIADNSNATYTIENADGKYVFNSWHGSALTDGFWVTQTITGLPAGKYQLNALIASDAANVITIAANETTSEYTLETAKGVGTEGSVTFNLATGADLVIKVSSPSWFKADDFRLYYFGKTEITIDDVANLIERYLNGEEGVNIQTITELIDEYLNQ